MVLLCIASHLCGDTCPSAMLAQSLPGTAFRSSRLKLQQSRSQSWILRYLAPLRRGPSPMWRDCCRMPLKISGSSAAPSLCMIALAMRLCHQPTTKPQETFQLVTDGPTANDSHRLLQEERRRVDPDTAAALDAFLDRLDACSSAETPFTLILGAASPPVPPCLKILREVGCLRCPHTRLKVCCGSKSVEQQKQQRRRR